MELEDLIEVYLTRVSKSSNLFLGSGNENYYHQCCHKQKTDPDRKQLDIPAKRRKIHQKEARALQLVGRRYLKVAIRLGLSFNVPNSKTIALDELSKPETDDPTSEKTTIEVAKDTEKKID